MSFWERMEQALNKGITTSREAFETAKEKARDLGDRGLLKYEVMQLEKMAEKRIAQLGTKVYEALVKDERNTVSKATPSIKPLLLEIEQIEKRIGEKEDLLKQG